ncbi:MAG: putative transport system ATP-binding protein [Eubacteriaceae bacterium]|jgi:putative ABC transport system ATP-binding protein|nr:putative transport system ATP-binding protein [Eubacteriaceae bacterium]
MVKQMKILEMKNLVKSYPIGDQEQVVLKGINLSVDRGDYLSVLGPSGSGKSTLMNIIGCLDVPTDGSYFLSGEPIKNRTETELAVIRNKEIGFIFQQFQLLPRLTALKNVELPLIYAQVPEKKRHEQAQQILERVGLADRMHHRPNQLSGGQQQRVAIARALVTEPTLLLADEPTGALDQNTGHQILKLFSSLHEEGKTIVMITHDAEVAKNGSRVVRIVDGNLTEEVPHA